MSSFLNQSFYCFVSICSTGLKILLGVNFTSDVLSVGLLADFLLCRNDNTYLVLQIRLVHIILVVALFLTLFLSLILMSLKQVFISMMITRPIHSLIFY